MNIKENNEYDGEIDEEVEEEFNQTQLVRRTVVYSGVKTKMEISKNLVNEIKSDEDPNLTFDRRFAAGYSSEVTKKHKTIKLPEHPNNLRLQKGVTMGISERFIGYFRLGNGLLWCHNQDELSSQEGIILDLLQQAGERVMRGQGVVSISLPVRIFEPRSTLER